MQVLFVDIEIMILIPMVMCLEGEICVFQELGWMDSDMNEMEEVIQADIDTLPTEIAEALKGDQYEECLAMAEEKMKSMDKKYKK